MIFFLADCLLFGFLKGPGINRGISVRCNVKIKEKSDS